MKSIPFSMNYLLEYSMVFDGELPDLATLLAGISKARLIEAATFFLGLSNQDSKFEHYPDFIEMFFSEQNNQVAQNVYDKIKAISGQQESNVKIVSQQSMLQFFEYGYNNLSDTDTQTPAESEVSVFKAMLILNEQNNILQEQGMANDGNVDEEIKLPVLALSMSYPNSEFINTDILDVAFGQMFRAVSLFEFLESRQDTRPLLKAFLAHFDMPSWQEYLKRMMHLGMLVVNAKKEGITDIHIDRNEEYEISCAFMDKLTLSNEGLLEEGTDFKSVRSKPLYKLKEGVYRVIYPQFAVELIFKSLYFVFNQVHSNLPKNEKVKGGNFRSYYCDYFSEQFLLYKILEYIYGGRNYIQHSGSFIKEQHRIDAEPDYYIRNGNYAFLYESKDILINAAIKQTFDAELYLKEFKKKFHSDTDAKGKIDNKAVLQLIKNVRRLLQKELPNDTNYKPSSLNIYPILILHDYQYNVSGLNAIVSYWFQEELKKLEAEGLDVSKVRTLTIIDIDTLITYQDNLKSGKLKLNELIDDYIKFSTPKKKNYRTNAELEAQHTNKLSSFFSFLNHHVKGLLRGRAKILMTKIKNLFNHDE